MPSCHANEMVRAQHAKYSSSFRLGVMSATTKPPGHLSSRAVSCSFRVSAKFDAFLGRYSHGKHKELDRPGIVDDCLLQILCFECGKGKFRDRLR
jgi:hypothetical protein